MRRLFRWLLALSKRFVVMKPRNDYERLAFDFLYAIGHQYKGSMT